MLYKTAGNVAFLMIKHINLSPKVYSPPHMRCALINQLGGNYRIKIMKNCASMCFQYKHLVKILER